MGESERREKRQERRGGREGGRSGREGRRKGGRKREEKQSIATEEHIACDALQAKVVQIVTDRVRAALARATCARRLRQLSHRARKRV